MSLLDFTANKSGLLKKAAICTGLTASLLLGKNDSGGPHRLFGRSYTALVHPLAAQDPALLALLTENEGFEPQFYLDTGGKKPRVTVGIGKLVPCEEDALKYPFCKMDAKGRLTKIPATEAEIRDAYRATQKQKSGQDYTAAYYRQFTRIGLHETDARQILAQDVAGTLDQLHHKFPEFDHMPPAIQLTLVDLRFNLGSRFDEKHWPKFYQFIHAGEVTLAKGVCHRIGVGLRNEKIEDLLDLGAEQLDADWQNVAAQKNLSLSRR